MRFTIQKKVLVYLSKCGNLCVWQHHLAVAVCTWAYAANAYMACKLCWAHASLSTLKWCWKTPVLCLHIEMIWIQLPRYAKMVNKEKCCPKHANFKSLCHMVTQWMSVNYPPDTFFSAHWNPRALHQILWWVYDCLLLALSSGFHHFRLWVRKGREQHLLRSALTHSAFL